MIFAITVIEVRLIFFFKKKITDDPQANQPGKLFSGRQTANALRNINNKHHTHKTENRTEDTTNDHHKQRRSRPLIKVVDQTLLDRGQRAKRTAHARRLLLNALKGGSGRKSGKSDERREIAKKSDVSGT
jgi:hypothetical protein